MKNFIVLFSILLLFSQQQFASLVEVETSGLVQISDLTDLPSAQITYPVQVETQLVMQLKDFFPAPRQYLSSTALVSTNYVKGSRLQRRMLSRKKAIKQ